MGKLKARPQDGFIFLDLLVAIFIASAAIVFIFSNISLTIRTARKIETRMYAFIEDRTEYAENRQIIFSPPPSE